MANTRKQLHSSLDAVEKFAAQFDGNPAKVTQLRAHLATVRMVVDDLFDTVPVPPSTD